MTQPRSSLQFFLTDVDALLLSEMHLCNKEQSECVKGIIAVLALKKLIVRIEAFDNNYFITTAGKAALLLYKHFGLTIASPDLLT